MLLTLVILFPNLIWVAQHNRAQVDAVRDARRLENTPVPTHASDRARSNWTSPDVSCAKHNDLRNFSLGDVGVRIDAAEPWADGFRRALGFWNTVLAANFHEEADLNVCAVRIIDGGPDIFNAGTVARAQLTSWTGFGGKIAVSSAAAKQMSSAEIYGAAVHELGHMLGLKHNANIHSVMYFLDIEGTEFLDNNDVSDLSRLHELRQAMSSKSRPLPHEEISYAVRSESSSASSATLF